MKTKSAVNFVLKHRKDEEGKPLTKYRLAKMMGAEPVSVDQWLRRTKMGADYRAIFYRLFKVQIND